MYEVCLQISGYASLVHVCSFTLLFSVIVYSFVAKGVMFVASGKCALIIHQGKGTLHF